MYVFLFFAFVLTPASLFNTLFHAGASLLTRTYCPGVFTALFVYFPLFESLGRLAHKEGLLDVESSLAVLLIAGVFHAWEVGYNVFKLW